MGAFLKIWSGQFCSTLGSYMTVFALMIWVWDQTQSVTALTLVGFFSQIPRLVITPFAGVIVDRYSRKTLLLLSDIVAAICTVAIAVLVYFNQLEIWHLYCLTILYGGFGQIQTLAYSTSIALLVEKKNYARAESLVAAVNYGAAIFSPILAGVLYPQIGLLGVIRIDIATFFIAFLTLLTTHIPQQKSEKPASIMSFSELTFGFRYIRQRPGLIAMVLAFSLFAIPSDIGKALYSPMILARAGGDSEILGAVTTAAGAGGVLGALLIGVSGGARNRVKGMLSGFIGTGLFKLLLGLGRTSVVWGVMHFLATLFIPLYYSSSNSIWYAKVPPALQGRVLAADQMIGLVIAAITPLLAGPLADRVFEPLAQSSPALQAVYGDSAGSGIALLYTLCAALVLGVGLAGFWVPQLRHLDAILPDHTADSNDSAAPAGSN